MADSIPAAVLEQMATDVVWPMGAERMAEFCHYSRVDCVGCVTGQTARVFPARIVFT